MPFFRAAGTRSLMLRPEAWRSEAEPLLELDLTSRDSLTLAGVDAAGSLTTSRLAERTLTCFTLTDPKLFTTRATERLARLRDRLFAHTEGVATVTAVRDPIDRVLAAVATSSQRGVHAGRAWRVGGEAIAAARENPREAPAGAGCEPRPCHCRAQSALWCRKAPSRVRSRCQPRGSR